MWIQRNLEQCSWQDHTADQAECDMAKLVFIIGLIDMVIHQRLMEDISEKPFWGLVKQAEIMKMAQEYF